MGISLDRALRVQTDFCLKLRDLYSTAASCSMAHSAICERWNDILAAMPKGTPEWVRSYLNGYRDCLTANLYREHLVFGGMVDGRFYSTHRNRDDYYEANGIEPSAYADNGRVKDRGHYWSRDLKPFFISSLT